MEPVKLSSKNQVVLPKEARKTLGVEAGDELFFVARRGIVYVLPRKRSLTQALRGIARGKLRYPAGYLRRERSSW